MDLRGLALLTADTFGVFTPDMAAEIGLKVRDVARLRRAGKLSLVCGRGHCVGAVTSIDQRLAAACMTWPDAIACFRTAARFHGFPVDDDGYTYVLVPRARRAMPGLIPRFWAVRATEVLRLGCFVVTDRRTTLADCLGRLPDDEAWGLLAWLWTRDRMTIDDIGSQIDERYHLYGVVRLREMVAALRRGAVSPGEVKFQDFLIDNEITGWLPDQKVFRGGRIVARVDVLFVEQKVVLEFDGKMAHPKEAKQRDGERDKRLEALGYSVIHVTWERMTTDHRALLREIRATLNAGGARVAS